MAERQRPAQPAVDDNGNQLATLAEIARIINERFPPIPGRQPVSRQLLHKSWQYQSRNKFPHPVKWVGSAHGGEGSARWDVEEVCKWYTEERHYRIQKTAQPIPKNTTHNTSSEDTLAA